MPISDLARGEQLAGYRVEALLGRGGMGVVYLAEDLRLKRRVALKLLAPELAENGEFRERFLRESELAASLDHPNVVPIYEAGEADGRLYISMRYVEGADLKTTLADGPLAPAHAAALVAQVAAALDAAHERGLVHRDVKPSNVLVDGRGHAYLGDFGLTRLLAEPGLSLPSGSSLGTPDYVAPEQIRGEELDGRADVYALGCLLYECLVGEPPFRSDSETATLFAHLEKEPPVLPGLEDVLARALAKDRDERFETCGALVADAREALGLGAPPRDRRPLVLAAAGLALIGAALAAFFLTRGGGGGGATGGSAVRIDPNSGKVARTIPVGRDPDAIAAGSGRVWTANFGDGTVSKIDPASGRAQAITVNGGPLSLAVEAHVVVVANGPPANSLTVIAADSGNPYDVVQLPDDPTYGATLLAAGPAGVWLADEQGATVSRVRAAVGSTTRVDRATAVPLGSDANLNGLAVGHDVWVTGSDLDRRLWRIDARTGRIASVTGLPIAPNRVATGAGAVWVTGEIDDVLLRVDPRTGRVTDRIPVGRGAAGVTVGAGSVWVANSLDGTVAQVDPVTRRVVRMIRVGGSPNDVTADAGSVWVASAR